MGKPDYADSRIHRRPSAAPGRSVEHEARGCDLPVNCQAGWPRTGKRCENSGGITRSGLAVRKRRTPLGG